MSQRLRVAVVAMCLLGVLVPGVALAAGPTIVNFTPTSGPVGTMVTINGASLQGVYSVKFNGTPATISSNNGQQLKAKVPPGASTGRISVTSQFGGATSQSNFVVTLGIALSKSAAPPRATLTLSGSAFRPNRVVDLYLDATEFRLVIADKEGTFSNVELAVPASALPGTHWVSAVDRLTGAGAQVSFLVRADWPQYGNVARHTAFNVTENVISPSTVSGLTRAWTGTMGGSSSAWPVVAGGRVYVTSYDEKLHAFAEGCATGGDPCTELWASAPTGYILSQTAAVGGGVVYIGGADGVKAYSVGCSTGCTALWTGPVGAPGTVAADTPTVAGGAVFVTSSGVGSIGVFAFAVGCGSAGSICSPLWQAHPGFVASALAVANGVVYVGTGGGVVAYDASCRSDGGVCDPLWHGDTPDEVDSSPAVANGVVYAGSLDGYLYAFGVGCNTGGGPCTPLWKGSLGGGFQPSTPAVANGIVYIDGNDSNLYAYAAGCSSGGGTCTPLWKGGTDGFIAPPTVANGVVYADSSNRKIYAWNATCRTDGGTCLPLWIGATGWDAIFGPVIANGAIYATSGEGTLRAWDLGDTGVTAPRTRPAMASLKPSLLLRPKR